MMTSSVFLARVTLRRTEWKEFHIEITTRFVDRRRNPVHVAIVVDDHVRLERRFVFPVGIVE